MSDAAFAIKAFFLLAIERILYAYWYCYPKHFERAVRRGSFGYRIQQEPLLWKCAMKLGMYVKVFQFSVVIADLVLRCNLTNPFLSLSSSSPEALYWAIFGAVLILIGQGLNYAVFKALKPIGVYYGYEFGYDVKMVSCFPYNTGFISDPQYWGVVLCIWGIYLMLGASSYIVPLLETFWYVMSMKVLEHPRGRKLAHSLFPPSDVNAKED